MTWVWLAFAAAASAQTGVPPGGSVLLRDDALATFQLRTTQDATAAADTTVDVTGEPFARARRITTTRDLSPAWAIELRVPLAQPAGRGDVALLHFFARSIAAADESGRARVRVVVQKSTPEFDKDLQSEVFAGREWQEFFLPFQYTQARTANESELAFGFGYKKQTVEIGGVELLDYGAHVALSTLPKTRFSYTGREPDAPWRRAALERIERLRRADFAIRVIDASGHPVVGATVHVDEQHSAFQWGSALQFVRLLHDSPDNTIYRAKALELFNEASPENDLKWPVWNGDWSAGTDPQQAVAALHWLNDHGFYVRGHVLVWPGWRDLPKIITEKRGTPQQNEIPEIVLAHIRDETHATAGLIREWDVLNEPYDHHDLMDLFGRNIMVDWFRAAAASVPGVRLFLNDYSNHDLVTDPDHFKNFEDDARFLQNSGAPLGGLGVQGHIGPQPNAPAEVLATLDRLAEFKLPIRFTEFDIDTDDEELQADYTRDFLILAFSHPSVIGVQYWGFWQGAHWRPRSAMFRTDWSPKPNATVYSDLVLNRWRTHLAGPTDAHGAYPGRGYLGQYEIRVTKDGRESRTQLTLTAGDHPTAIDITLR